MVFFAFGEVLHCEIDEVESTEELEPSELDEPRCEEECDPPKNIRPDDSVLEGFLLEFWLQVFHHSCEDCSVVDREDSLHEHEAKNDNEIRSIHILIKIV